MNRILVAIGFLLVSGCSSTPTHTGTFINFNIKQGYFERIQVSTWTPDQEICTVIVANSPHFGEKWRPVTGLQLKEDETGDWYSIELVSSSNRDSLNLVANYKLGDDRSIIPSMIQPKINYGEIVQLKIEIIDFHFIKITGEEFEFVEELGIKPNNLSAKASSINSSFGFSDEYCNW